MHRVAVMLDVGPRPKITTTLCIFGLKAKKYDLGTQDLGLVSSDLIAQWTKQFQYQHWTTVKPSRYCKAQGQFGQHSQT